MRGHGWWRPPAAGFAAADLAAPASMPGEGRRPHLGRVLRPFRFQGRGVSPGGLGRIAVLRNGVAAFQQQHGRAWRDPFVDFYLGERMELALSEACGLPSFSPDVARADDATRAVYEEELTRLVELVAAGFRGAHADQRAWSFLAVLSGAAAMARAVKDARVRREILTAAGVAAKAI